MQFLLHSVCRATTRVRVIDSVIIQDLAVTLRFVNAFTDGPPPPGRRYWTGISRCNEFLRRRLATAQGLHFCGPVTDSRW